VSNQSRAIRLNHAVLGADRNRTGACCLSADLGVRNPGRVCDES
jgi:hypothetical protein